MAPLRFEWDARKSLENRKKHGVSFEEAQAVFFDEHAAEFYDERHSGSEDRFLMLGKSFRARLLLVAHTYRGSNSVIRIISARKATAKERREYRRRGP